MQRFFKRLRKFQSTLPVGGATRRRIVGLFKLIEISIHAPRGGSDCSWLQRCCSCPISIHAPRGGSDHQKTQKSRTSTISIHAPRGGSDNVFDGPWAKNEISIHAPRGGSDTNRKVDKKRFTHFNPRSPWGERPVGLETLEGVLRHFNPRSPWGERPACPCPGIDSAWDFNPRSPWGERRNSNFYVLTIRNISIHAPRGGSDC